MTADETGDPIPSATIEDIIRLFEGDGAGSVDHLLHEEIELRPPTYGKSWRGRALVGRLLGFAASAIEDMRYTSIWHGPGQHVLRFEGRVGDEHLSGVDIVHVDSAGLITQFEIFARPPRAIMKLRDAMAERVRSDAVVATMMQLAG